MTAFPDLPDVITLEGGDLTEKRVAVFSADMLYRYALAIVWAAGLPMLVAVMLNPSTADHMENDPTVQRICERARRMGLGGVLVLNAFAWRETDRLKMLKVADPVGPHNDLFLEVGIRLAKAAGGVLLVGWGNEGGHRRRSEEVAALIRECEGEAVCLRLCANGQPGHPLYIGYDAPLIPWPKAA